MDVCPQGYRCVEIRRLQGDCVFRENAPPLCPLSVERICIPTNLFDCTSVSCPAGYECKPQKVSCQCVTYPCDCPDIPTCVPIPPPQPQPVPAPKKEDSTSKYVLIGTGILLGLFLLAALARAGS
jgi:hypothetical protein